MNEHDEARQERDQANAETSEVLGRPRILMDGEDVTEQVVSVLSALWGSLDWGSGFLDDEELEAAKSLMTALKFKCGANGWTAGPKEGGIRFRCVLPYDHEGSHTGENGEVDWRNG